MLDWYHKLSNSNLTNSSLLLAEYIYKYNGDYKMYKNIIKHLYALRCHFKILEMIENNVDLLRDFDIRIILYKCITETNIDVNINNYENIHSYESDAFTIFYDEDIHRNLKEIILNSSESECLDELRRAVEMLNMRKEDKCKLMSHLNIQKNAFKKELHLNMEYTLGIGELNNETNMNYSHMKTEGSHLFKDALLKKLDQLFRIQNLKDTEISDMQISKESILLLEKALTKRDIIRKNLLIESFCADIHNMESIYHLFKDELITSTEFDNILNIVPKEMQVVYQKVFLCDLKYYSSMEFYHPFYIFLISKYLYLENNKTELMTLSHKAYRVYKENINTYLSLGLYFLLIKNYKESKRIFLKILEDNKNNGHVYLYLGICYSRLRECENSISCFTICNKRMLCTWKSYFYLGYEYQRMTNFEKSKYNYLEGLEISRNMKIQEGYVSLLIFCEEYKEALSYLSSMASTKNKNAGNVYLDGYLVESSDSNIYLLKCYCYLFLGNIPESRKYLEMCSRDYKYYCTLGYIEHLMNNLDKACDLYNKSLLLKESTVIDNLMCSALEREKENDVYNSCTEIFEYLFISSMEINII